MGRGLRMALFVLGSFLLWIVLPAGWLFSIGLIGTNLGADIALPATVGLFALLFVGLPLTWLGLARVLVWLHPQRAADMGLSGSRRPRLRLTTGGQRAAAGSERAAPEPSDVGFGRRVLADFVLGVMFLVCFSVWTLVPLGWLWVGSLLAGSTQPEFGPYLLVLGGIGASMVVVMFVLSRLDSLHGHLTSHPAAYERRSAWLRSMRDAPRSRELRSPLDFILVASVIAATLALATWFFFFAEQSSVVQQYLN